MILNDLPHSMIYIYICMFLRTTISVGLDNLSLSLSLWLSWEMRVLLKIRINNVNTNILEFQTEDNVL